MPDRGLTNIYIDKLIRKKLKIGSFVGVYSCDNVPVSVLKSASGCFVCNTSPRNAPGEHFIAVLVTCVRVYVFDSLARNIESTFPKLYSRLCKSEKPVHAVFRFPVQSSSSLYCGYYCAFFIAMLNREAFDEGRLKGLIRPLRYRAFRANDVNVVHNIKCLLIAVNK